jgi:hypothetical protein
LAISGKGLDDVVQMTFDLAFRNADVFRQLSSGKPHANEQFHHSLAGGLLERKHDLEY